MYTNACILTLEIKYNHKLVGSVFGYMLRILCTTMYNIIMLFSIHFLRIRCAPNIAMYCI